MTNSPKKVGRHLTPQTLGTSAYLRMLRNGGVSFSTAYWLIFGRLPKTRERLLDWALAVAIGLALAFILFMELSK